KPMLAPCTNHHRILSASQPDSGTPCPVLHQLPACGVGIGKTGKATAGAKARKARRLPCLHPSKESLKGTIQPAQGFLQGMTAQLHYLRAELLDRRQGFAGRNN